MMPKVVQLKRILVLFFLTVLILGGVFGLAEGQAAPRLSWGNGQAAAVGESQRNFTVMPTTTNQGEIPASAELLMNSSNLITFTIYLPIALKPGWATLTSGTAQQLNGISCPASSTCFAVGNSGTILATTNSGATWTAQPSGTGVTLNDVSCKDTQTCMAVGDNGTIIGTTNGGTSWSARTSNTTQILRGVGCKGTACLATGGTAISEAVYSINSGETWAREKVGNTNLYDAACLDGETCTTVGDGGRAVTFTIDIQGPKIVGGAQGLHHSLTLSRFVRVDCPSGEICFTVGQNGTIFKTSDRGLHWGQQTSSTTVDLAGVSCSNATTCYAVGGGGKIITTADGTTWADDPLNSSGNITDLKAVSCTSGTCYAVGANGVILSRR